jgi:hypothetical protein
MKKHLTYIFIFLLLGITVHGKGLIHHNISAKLNPEKHFIEVSDIIRIPKDYNKPLVFVLNNNLKVRSENPKIKIKLLQSDLATKDIGIDFEQFDSTVHLRQNQYSIEFSKENPADSIISLSYSGFINYPIAQAGEEYARGFNQTPGIIDAKGIYLAGSSVWYPLFDDSLITFRLEASVPAGWKVVSQGNRDEEATKNSAYHVVWNSPDPSEEIYVIGAQWTEYSQAAGSVNVYAFLRTPDDALAKKYLDATAQYLELYRKLIGPYPYAKFALVENFWETGYGMPSFTLLGEQIIRFPFILNSSYPHELLHNYWGNGVYVDGGTGNWCEGLTAYLADHLIAEQRGQAEEYRRNTLQKYTDFVTPENDFPLNKFRGRYSASSEAIGYGKTSFLWNMLRDEIGDDNFTAGLKRFYKDKKFQKASFSDLRAEFEAVSGKDLKKFFEQWVDRTGAPELSLSKVETYKDLAGYHVRFTISQLQNENVFTLSLPVAIQYNGKAELQKVQLSERIQTYDVVVPSEPEKIQIDPQFAIFRRVSDSEFPPALTKFLGANELTLILPSKVDSSTTKVYAGFAKFWAGDAAKKIIITSDADFDKLPADRNILILGNTNKFASVVSEGIKNYGAEIKADAYVINKTTYPAANNSFVTIIRNPGNPKLTVGFLSAANAKASEGLGRKIPHYGKYGYLVFDGDEPTNVAKGEWPVLDSPLAYSFSNSAKGTVTGLPQRKALAVLEPIFSSERLKKSVDYLASEELAGRAPGSPGIEKAAKFIEDGFKSAGLLPGGDDSTYFQSWREVVDSAGNKAIVRNIIGIIPGTNPKLAGESVLITAHYDHLGKGWPTVHTGDEGKIHYGADDNASGVAVLLELAQTLGKSLKPQRTVIFVAFTNEEEGLVGSKYFINNYKRFSPKKIIGDLNFDVVGRLQNKRFLILGASSAREWKFIFQGAGYTTGVESEVVNQEISSSDQKSFIDAGIPGVQFFSGVNNDYHRPTDTPDKIDVPGLVKAATLGKEVLEYLSERNEPLTFNSGENKNIDPGQQKGDRKVSTGSVPDFAFSGAGVKLSEVQPGSPADKAGLQAGDIIVKLGGAQVVTLRDYSDALKKFQPGDKADVAYQRGGKELTTKIEFIAK